MCIVSSNNLFPIYTKQTLYTGFHSENLREREHLEDPTVDGRIILRRIFRKWNLRTGTGSIWLRKGTGGGHL
jgi:hypothetical protein